MTTATLEWFEARSTPEPTTGCWLWTRAVAYNYGVANLDGRTRRAHRAALEFRIGRNLKPDECSLHSCDQPSCVNPNHLWVGSNADNMADKKRKGRESRNPQRSGAVADAGPAHPNRTITPEQVRWAIEVTNKPLGPRRKGIEREGTWSWAAKQLGVSLSGLRDAARVLS